MDIIGYSQEAQVALTNNINHWNIITEYSYCNLWCHGVTVGLGNEMWRVSELVRILFLSKLSLLLPTRKVYIRKLEMGYSVLLVL